MHHTHGAPVLLLALAGTTLAADPPAPLWPPFPAQLDLESLPTPEAAFVLNGAYDNSWAGALVSGGGDVNGDGFDDVLLSFPRYTRGRCAIVFGGPTSELPGAIDLSALDGSDGVVVRGSLGGFLGACAPAGDFNGDGIDDVVLGDSSAEGLIGQAYVLFGSQHFGAPEIALPPSSHGVKIFGDLYGDLCGWAVAPVGDMNGDGFDDVAISAPQADPFGRDRAGTVYVLFGSPQEQSISVRLLCCGSGFTVYGSHAQQYCGRSLSSADVNGDGFSDLIISSFERSSFLPGEAYVIFGGPNIGGALGHIDADTLDGTDGFAIRGIDNGDRAGSGVSAAGDVNGDGIDDILLAADAPRECYVVFGSPTLGQTGLFELSSLDGTNGFILSGGFVSNCVAGLGDLNHDGIDDFAVCSIPTINVIFGRPNIGASGVLSFPFGEPNGLNGANGFTIEGPSIISTSLSRAGDFNADGIDDFIVGDRFADPYGIDRAGRAYVVFGHPTPLPADVDGERRIDLDGNGSVDVFDFAILAASFGASVPPETAGDIDADGVVTVFDFALFAAGFGCSP